MKPAILLLFVVAVIGCNKSGPIDPYEGYSEEQVAVSEFIGAFSDDSASPTFKDHFVNPPSAAELKKYRNLYFSANEVEVNGNSATALVAISKPGEMDPIAETSWKLTKTGETWKIESAPLN